MRSMGIDLASTNYSAAAMAIDGVPDRAVIWKPDDPKDSDPEKLVAFEKWLAAKMFAWQPDIVVVEKTMVIKANPQTALSISLREGVALLVAKKRKNVIVISVMIGQSRSIILSKGNLSKEDAFDEFKKMYPKLKLVPKSSGGMDQADAMVHALAGPTHLERRK
jgi:Holliday junction resolvasome RuvABC endonuclease subunit